VRKTAFFPEDEPTLKPISAAPDAHLGADPENIANNSFDIAAEALLP
jgi:hypothetical protein